MPWQTVSPNCLQEDGKEKDGKMAFIVQYEKPPQSYHNTLEEAQEATKDRKWLRIYEIDVAGHEILQNIYPARES